MPEIPLDGADKMCYTEENNTIKERPCHDKNPIRVPRQDMDIIGGTVDFTGLFRLTPFDLTPH